MRQDIYSDINFQHETDFDTNAELSPNTAEPVAPGAFLEPDINEAQRFLKLLDPHATAFTFQTFDDSKDKKRPHLTRVFHGPLTTHFDELTRLNREGAGIFVTVQETNSNGRATKDILKVRSIFGDFDEGLPGSFALEPSITVESSPGKYQCYWLCEEITFDDFPGILRRMIDDYGADKRAKDIARVLRVPGFFHRKEKPSKVTIIKAPGRIYGRDAILSSFPPKEHAGHNSGGSLVRLPPKQKAEQPREFDEKQLQAALDHISSDEYSVWRDVGCAIHHATGGSEDGFSIWEQWSRKSPKFCPHAARKDWLNYTPNKAKPITLGTLFYYAVQGGWVPEPASTSWPEVSSSGKPIGSSHRNINAALDRLDITVTLDRFKSGVIVHYPGEPPEPLDDAALRSLRFNAEKMGLKCPKDYFSDAVFHLAEKNPSNICTDYLDGLRWDGRARLDRLFVDYCGAEDTEFNRAVGRKFMVAAVRRVKKPGTKFDHLVVLEGKQGAKKSGFGSVLAGADKFTDNVDLGHPPKIIAELTRGKWIVEFAELVGITKKETEHIKSMLTRQTDSARMSFDRITSDFPRQFVFLGSTNSDRYLIDTTGNRRFWPVKVGIIDLELLAEDRDQLWAEAVKREAEGEQLWLPDHLAEVAHEVQKARQIVNPQEERLQELVSGKFGIIPKEELFSAIGLDAMRTSNRKPSHEILVDRVMKNAGWEADRLRNPHQSSGQDGNIDNRCRVFKRISPDGSIGYWLRFDPEKQCFVTSRQSDSEDFSEIVRGRSVFS